jgi:tetratricopeptide (TPR) repeat protein
MRLVFPLVLALSLVGAAGASDPQDVVRRGTKALQAGDYLKAAEAFEEALRADPASPMHPFLLGQAYHGLFRRTGLFYREALDNYTKVVESLDEDSITADPRRPALLFLGQLLIHGGEYRAAIERLRGFLARQPGYYALEAVWNSLGVAYYYLNEYEDAVQSFQEALKADPSNGPARFNLRSVFTRLSVFDQAMANRRIGRLDLALEDLGRLLTLAPRYGPARLQTALLLRDLSRPAEAEAEIVRALSFEPGPKVAFGLRDLLGDIRAARGDAEAALAEYRQCLRIFPGYVQVVEKIDLLEKQAEPQAAPAGPASSEEAPVHAAQTPLAEFPL